MQKQFDYIIIGGGAAGLNCALELNGSSKSVLLIEKERKNQDDRTWCYWEEGPGKFDHILHKAWNQINFYGENAVEGEALGDYQYKMIRSSSFYAYADKILSQSSNIERVQANVSSCKNQSDSVTVDTDQGKFVANRVLDSVFFPAVDTNYKYYVAQHFGGWFIETEEDVIDDESATFMDFRIDQKGDTRFFYVLPFSKRKALVEIAVFSNDIMDMKAYDQEIEAYINEYMKLDQYSITEKEIGVIPMTSYPFHKHSSDRIIKIGTAGGWVKPSAGFAFKRIIERSEKLIQQLENNEKLDTDSSVRHRWMDKVMLKAIEKKYVSGKQVFDSLFSKRKPEEVFRFLDEKNNFFQDLTVMYSAPIIPFTKAALF